MVHKCTKTPHITLTHCIRRSAPSPAMPGRGRAKGGGFVLLGRQKWSHRPPGVWAGWFGGPLGSHRLQSPCGALGPSTDVPGGASRGLALLPDARSTYWVRRHGKWCIRSGSGRREIVMNFQTHVLSFLYFTVQKAVKDL